MAKMTLLVALALAFAASAALVAAPAAARDAASPASGLSWAAQTAGGGNSNLLTIVFATLGASIGAAGLATLAYLLRRRLGMDWHRSQGAASGSGRPEEAPATMHSGHSDESERGKGGTHP